MSELDHQLYWVYFIYYFTWTMIWIQFFEFMLVFMHKEKAITDIYYDRFFLAKKCLGLVTIGMCIFCLVTLFQWNQKNIHIHRKITALTTKECIDTETEDGIKGDKILIDIFN